MIDTVDDGGVGSEEREVEKVAGEGMGGMEGEG